MARILNDDGTYAAPPPPAPRPVPTAEGLPKQKGDPFAHVDVRAYSQAPQLSRSQLIQMGAVAEMRGDSEAAMFWKTRSAEAARSEATAVANKQMIESMKPKTVPRPGSRIVESRPNTPWDHDSGYQRLANKYLAAKEVAEGALNTDPKVVEKRAAQADAHDAMVARQQEIKDDLRVSGVWTEMDDRQLDAERSLASKASKVANQMKTST